MTVFVSWALLALQLQTAAGPPADRPRADGTIGGVATAERAITDRSTAVGSTAAEGTSPGTALDSVLPNDNRTPAGIRQGARLVVQLEARLASWRPDPDVDSMATVQVFAEPGGPPRIPGPLLRAATGTEIRVRLRNRLDSTLVVHGLRAGTVGDDTVHIPAGGIREVTFVAGQPGTYLYWGTTTRSPIGDRPWRDSQLTGAIVVDAAGAPADPAERIFVITVLDIYKADSVRNAAGEDVWEVAINGRSWPHTERLAYTVGDTVRWRWLNGSYLPHPMHLHGFHFRVRSRGTGTRDTSFAPGSGPLEVTELMGSGTTFAMEWVPSRGGNWLMHCHMLPHIKPFPDRPDSTRNHDTHDVARHALEAMAGLVLGITVEERGGTSATTGSRVATRQPVRHLRVFVQEAAADSGRPVRRSYVLARGSDPAADSVEVPGPPIVLTRDETTAITVINRLREPTTVHWHGMELESVFDGVSGWSGGPGKLAPLIAPGDSFTVVMTAPRAGTFIYHTHMDEGEQLNTGLYAPLIVLEPGERYAPDVDRTFMIGGAVLGDTIRTAVNGRVDPPPLELTAGTRYRLRFVNILEADAASVVLVRDAVPLSWQPLAKDGAELVDGARAATPSRLAWIGVGETYDFEWAPPHAMDAELVIRIGSRVRRQVIRVRE